MEEDENQEVEEQSLGQEVAETGKQIAGQAAKDAAKKVAKEAGKAAAEGIKTAATHALAAASPYLIPIIIGMIVFVVIVGGIFVYKDKIIETLTNISTSISSFIGMGDNGPVAPSAKEMTDLIDKALKEQGINVEDLGLGNEKQTKAYLYKYMVASLSTQLPYIKESTAQTLKEIALKGTLLYELDKRTEVQGIVKIKRRTGNSTKDLSFKKYEDFEKMINENNTSAVNYFSIDESWMLCIAKHNIIKTETADGNITEDHSLEEVKIPYQTMVSKYSVPFEFFIALQQITLNPEYVSAVADLIQDHGEIEFTIFDSTEVIQTDYTYKYKVKKKWVETTTTDSNTTTSTTTSTTSNTTGATTTEKKTSVSDEKTEITKTVQTINTITANITKANVWVINQETKYQKENPQTEYPLGENGVTTEIPDEDEPAGDTGEWKIDRSENTKQTINKEIWKSAGSNVKINSDKFLGLWRNLFGSYVEGASYMPKPIGALVKYKVPESKFREESPIENILSSEDWLYDLLEKSENTQTHAQLMRYLIALYKANGDTSKVDIALDLSIFNPDEFVQSSYNGGFDVHNEELFVKDEETLKKALSAYSNSTKLVENARSFSRNARKIQSKCVICSICINY